MNEKTNFQSLLVAILLISLGIISPSNGVDDEVYKSPSEMISDSLFAIILGILTFLIINAIAKGKLRKANGVDRQN